jgi:DNA-binding response OmpR family regulator
VVSAGQTAEVNILVVEDDPSIAESVRSGLESQNMRVSVVDTGAAALEATGYDVMLLDIGLPDIDGFEVCRRIRTSSNVPIIMLTARADEIDKVLGLESGADDYVPKPFGLRELVARIRAVSRRAQHDALPAQKFAVGPLVVDVGTRRCFIDEDEIGLTAKEFDLLAHLMESPGVVQRRRDILEAVWETDWYGPTKTLDAHIASLRKKLGHPEWIESVRGVGFRLDVG